MSAQSLNAVRWWRNGDHPDDRLGEEVPDPAGSHYRREGAVVRFFRHPNVDGAAVHDECGRTWRDHGWIDEGPDGMTVCPGDVVVTWPNGMHDVYSDLSGALRLLGEGARLVSDADYDVEMPTAVHDWLARVNGTLPFVPAEEQPERSVPSATTGGFALRHDLLTAPPVHIPDGNGGAYKTELVLERTDERTEKLVWWHADDPRPEPHNHPWDFTSTILHGGYTEDRYSPNGTGSFVITSSTYRADGTEDGNVNEMPRDAFHVVYNVLPGTVSHMICGPAAPGNEWGYLDRANRDRLIDPLTVYDDFPALLRALNPHLRSASEDSVVDHG